MILGLLSRASQAIGLHIVPKSWALSNEAAKERMMLFWEAFACDAQTSLIFGRAPASFVAPVKLERELDVDEGSRYFWIKHRLAEVAGAIAQDAFLSGKQSYDRVRCLDAELNRIESTIPESLQWAAVVEQRHACGRQPAWSANHQLLQALQLASQLHKVTMFLHLPWLQLLLKEGMPEPIDSILSLSFTKSINAAQATAHVIQTLVLYCPHEASLEWSFPSNGIMAATVLAACIVGAPTSPMTMGLWRDLRLLIDAISATPLNSITKASSKLLRSFSDASRNAIALRARHAGEDIGLRDEVSKLDLLRPTAVFTEQIGGPALHSATDEATTPSSAFTRPDSNISGSVGIANTLGPPGNPTAALGREEPGWLQMALDFDNSTIIPILDAGATQNGVPPEVPAEADWLDTIFAQIWNANGVALDNGESDASRDLPQ